MNQIETLYRWLARDESPAASSILAAALEHAEPPYAGRITRLLLGRRHESAWAGLVAHFAELTPEAQLQVLAQPQRLRAGLALALTSPRVAERIAALQLLQESPQPLLSPHVAEALRDASPQLGEAAASALRVIAEQMIDEVGFPARLNRGPLAVEYAALAQGVREAFRTFELHRQTAVLEVSLWFAKYLGAELWTALADRRHPAGALVSRHLIEWNSPRLASFLLLGLTQPAWRDTAYTMLDSWNTRDHTLAILQNTDLLDVAAVRRALRMIKHPLWLAAAGPELTELPTTLRAKMPLWICHLGLPEDLRLRFLTHWLSSAHVDIQRTAAYALAQLDTVDAIRALLNVAQRPGPMRNFARWFALGRRSLSQYIRAGSPVAAGDAHGWPPESSR
jgi:hypothetical protein